MATTKAERGLRVASVLKEMNRLFDLSPEGIVFEMGRKMPSCTHNITEKEKLLFLVKTTIADKLDERK